MARGTSVALGRRLFCITAGTAVVSACFGGGSSATPAPGAPGDGGAVGWSAFAARFLDASGRIVDTGNRGVSHSEGQGYGMVMAFFANDRAGFARLWDWTRTTLLTPDGLLSWRYDPAANPPVGDPNNATDGDILVAWALGLAGHAWNRPDWLQQAATMRAAILQHATAMVAGRRVLLPGATGFATAGHATLNPAYYVWPALDAFHATAPVEGWDRIIADGTWLLSQARFGTFQLPCDWIDLSADGAVLPAAGRDPWFGFDAVRVPLYAQLGGRSGLARPAAEWWAGRMAAGQPVPAWIEVTTGITADYPASAGVQAIIARIDGGAAPAELATDYYAAVLQVLATLRP